jgi:hypothetical protein
MAIYRVPFSLTAGATSAANLVLANFKAGAQDRVTLRALFAFIEGTAPTNAPIIGLQRMNAVGTGAITSSVPAAADPADGTPASVLETAWATTRPTVTGLLLMRAQVALALASNLMLDMSLRGIVIPVNGGLCLTQVNAGGATGTTLGGWAELEE